MKRRPGGGGGLLEGGGLFDRGEGVVSTVYTFSERKGTPFVLLPLKKVTPLTHLLNKNKLLAIFV